MKVGELMKRLQSITDTNLNYLNYDVHIITEADHVQVEQRLGEIAVSKNTVILLPEGFD